LVQLIRCSFFSQCTQCSSLKTRCKDVQRIHEDHIHVCCKHPDGHNDITELCAKQTNFKLPSAKEEAMEDLTVDQVMTGFCWAECVFEQYKLLDADKKLNMTAVRSVFKNVHDSDAEYEREMIAAFDLCHSKTEEATAQFLSSPLIKTFNKNVQCEPQASIVLSCAIHNFFHNCPRNRWSNSTECEETLAFSKKCKDVLTTM
ncbi:hypothetical protein KR222_010797, partial [Zaprionus bogoriensis]